jgi:hypothetical protein
VPFFLSLPVPVPVTIHYDVLPYSEENLAIALSNERGVTPEQVRARHHFSYFREYFGDQNGGLGARTILTEAPYVSQSFLSDYADYYAHCFAPYDRYCKRVHFFAQAFDGTALDAALQAGDADPIWASYLGYIVIKPLPNTQVGATVLRPYGSVADKQRRYPVCRPYHINILGHQLTIDSLIFQEQDSVVGACATMALWIAFHKTAFLFQTTLPSPYQITAATRNLFRNSGRNFPNQGLDLYQVGNAIESVGLVQELRQYIHPAQFPVDGDGPLALLQEQRRAKAVIYSYLRMGLPVLLFINLEGMGGHLITVTGYREATGPAVSPTQMLSLVSDGIERLYVHDDQIGPFARIGFAPDGYLETAWPENGDWTKHHRAAIDHVSVPLGPGIRITFEQVYEQAAFFNRVLALLLHVPPTGITWDIYLDLSNRYKQEVRANAFVEEPQLRRTVTRLLPKYVWVARATLPQAAPVPLVEMVFDATDLHTGFFCLLVNVLAALRPSLTQWLSTAAARTQLLGAPGFHPRLLDLLLDDLELDAPTA